MSNSTSKPAVRSALTWFEIPTKDFERARTFYGAILEAPLLVENFGPGRIAMFPYERPGIGGCLDEKSESRPSDGGTVVYLDVSGRFGRTLELVERAGGTITMPETALPPGMGVMAHILDSEGNRVGLHAIS